MKIISSGTLCSNDNSVIFTCPNCGCKFKMEQDEYYMDSSWSCGDSITVNYTIYNYTRYHANCPECHKMCHESGKNSSPYYVTCDGTSNSLNEVSSADT